MLNSTYHSEPATRRVRNPVVTVAEEEEEEVRSFIGLVRYQKPWGIERIVLSFCAFSLPLAWQEQFACQGRKNFFCKKGIDIAYAYMVKSPPGARGDFILVALGWQEQKACQVKKNFLQKKAIDKEKNVCYNLPPPGARGDFITEFSLVNTFFHIGK